MPISGVFFRQSRAFFFLALLCFVFSHPTLSFSKNHEVSAIKIGVLAKRGQERALTNWEPTADYLTASIPGQKFEIIPLDFEGVRMAVMSKRVDFIITNSGYFAALQADHRLRHIATLISLQQGLANQFFGGVIFTRSDRNDINQLKDLIGKSFWAVDQESLGGWLAAWREFFAQGIQAERDFSLLNYAGTHDAVVFSVLNGEADAGTVRTDTLEQMAAEGAISLADFKILNIQKPDSDFGFLLSTRLYPEWPFAALPHTPDKLVNNVTAALLAMPADSPAARAAKIVGWTKPLNIQAVQDLFRELHLYQYEKYIGEITLTDFLRKYWLGGALLTIVLSLVVLLLIYKDFLNKQLERRVAEKTDELHQQIVERKQTEEKLHRAEKMEAIGMMASGVAHDLNNILSGIVSYPELLLMRLPEESELRKPIMTIKDAGLRAAEVVEDLLTVARDAAKVRTRANINTLILEYLQSPEASKIHSLSPRIKISTELDESVEPICCSPTHVNKCIMNLMINATEAIDGLGHVVVRTEICHLEAEEAKMLGVTPGRYVTLAVTDDGSGIEPDDVQHIFEPFYTKKKMGRSGTGIGLSVVWNSMQDHSGTVTVRSDYGGTTFTLFFPLIAEGCSQLPSDEEIQLIDITEELMGHGESLLVVDDELHQREITLQIIKELGYQGDSIDSGEGAVMLVEKKSFDLLLLDMVMDPGMDGLQTYATISRFKPEQKALIISGFSESEKVEQILSLGVSGFLKKPYTLKQLAVVIKNALKN